MLDVSPRSVHAAAADFLAGGGEMGRLMREMDWTRTRLGPPGDWPLPLRTAARMVLASRHPVCVWWGADCELLFNDACQPLLGSDAANALGMPAPTAWLEGPPHVCVRIAHEGVHQEKRYALALTPVPGENGALGGVLCTFFDVTPAVPLAGRFLVEALPVAVYTTDAEGRLQLFNEAARELWGRDPVVGVDRFCGSARIFTPDGAPVEIETCAMARVLEGREVEPHLEIVIERPDGTSRHVLAHPRLMRDDGGRVVGAVNVLVDISWRKDAEAELAATKDELAQQVESLTQLHELALRLGSMSELPAILQAVLDTAVDAQDADFGIVWMHDHDTGCLVAEASRNFAQEALAHFSRVVPGPAGGAAGNAFSRHSRWIIEDVESDPGFEPFRQGARAAGFRAVHSTPIVTSTGELLGVISVHFARKHRPSQRDMQIADVCARHAADSIENFRSQQAMRQSEEELRELDQRKNEFLATLAHELRNPLAPLRNGLEVMRLASANPATVEKARAMMQRQLSQMVRLVDDLLDVSRVSRGKIELRREDVELSAVLRNAIETSQPLMAERNHQLVTRIPQERIVIHGDVTRLSQVFWNLLNNAAKYTLPGGVIELAAVAEGAEIEVSIRDNGIGIPHDMQSRVFDIFTQVDRSLEKSQGGLGIGLSIAKRLVQMHAGTISVRSEGHNKGSVFTVRLPVVVDAEIAKPQPQKRTAAGISGRRILVADDNTDSASTLAMLLETAGNEVRVAHDGHEAITVGARFQPEVVLLDIGMPRKNGYDACKEMRAQSWAEDAYFVALTGWAQPQDRDQAHAAGFDCHLVKPVEPASLERLIRELPRRGA